MEDIFMEKTIEQEKRIRALKTVHRIWTVLCFLFAVLAILLLIGAVVTLIMAGGAEENETLLYILTGSFAGGAVAFSAAAVGSGQLARRASARELDFRERCDSENSFFVGDGTLATFEEGFLRIHSELRDGKEEIRVPYADMRFFSVCTRKRPREKGSWTVALEIPARYLTKTGRDAADGRPALVQTDGKERLYACLEAFGLELLGEKPPRGEKPASGKFTRTLRCSLPNAGRRRQSLMFIGLGGVFIVAGVLVAVFLNLSVGVVLAMVGVVALGRSVLSFLRAKATLAVYREGVYWQDSTRTDSVFLKWEEIQLVRSTEREGTPCLEIVCAYGAYHFPNPAGVYEYIKEHFPEKCRE